MSVSPLRVGLAGLGTVGAGVAKLLQGHAETLARRGGRPIEIAAVSARSRRKDRGVDLSSYRWFDDPVALARDPGVDVVIEVMGGSDGPAKAAVEAALGAGKPVVTANKALLAAHGPALARLAEEKGVQIRYEAAVAGGIPAIKALREGLAGSRVRKIYGVLNGTCNYILTEMEKTGRDYADILKDAQRMGYAEADPTADVGGFDAANKLAILSALAFGIAPDLDAIEIEGIQHIHLADMELARDLGYRVRLVTVAAQGDDGRVEQRVSPCMVPADSEIGRLDGVTNAVLLEGEPVGRIALIGPGAGEGPTASAVVADLIDLARDVKTPVFGVPAAYLGKPDARPVEDHQGAYYLRFLLRDKPGALASVTAALGAEGVSIELMRQLKPRGDLAPVAIVTHDAREGDVRRALARIGGLPMLGATPVALRIETL